MNKSTKNPIEYITALQAEQKSKNSSDKVFFQLIAEYEIEAQKDYCRMFRIELPENDTQLE